MLPHASVMLLPVLRGRITASILLFFVCLNSCRLSGHLPRAALLAVGVWESPERILNDTTGEKRDSPKDRKGSAIHLPPTSLLAAPRGLSQGSGKGQGVRRHMVGKEDPRELYKWGGSAFTAWGSTGMDAWPTTALLRITSV